MRGFNQVELIGNVVKDPYIKEPKGGNVKNICKITLAVNRPSRAGEKAACDFLDITFFNSAAVLVSNHVKKGMALFVIGHLNKTEFEVDGQRKSVVTIIGDRINFLSRPVSKENEAEPETNENTEMPTIGDVIKK